jgi:hypothetical protein
VLGSTIGTALGMKLVTELWS